MKDRKIVIFGASGGALKVADTFENLMVNYLFFVDNDKNKWGKCINGKEVCSPDKLFADNYDIIIASDYQEEIELQLKDMNLLHRLILKEEIIMEYISDHIGRFERLKISNENNRQHKVVVELADAGICLGGIETWALMVTRGLKERGIDVLLYSKLVDDKTPCDLKSITKLFDFEYTKYAESLYEVCEELIKILPCTVISSWQSQVMLATIIVKKIVPDHIKIISVVHNDKLSLYRRQAFLEPYTDLIMGVSKKINRVFRDDYGIPEDKIIYKESPVSYEENFKKNYTLDDNLPIKIGFAARIDKFQKRADLLILLIKELEELKVNYLLKVAGKGNYFNKLESFICEQNLQNKVVLIGRVPREEMSDFWKSNDVFLSVSDFEGTSISMLEAMSYGVVPIVTNVSGVDEFVMDGFNGYVSDIRDVSDIAIKIKKLDKNRSNLHIYGDRSREMIRQKCNERDYINYMISKLS